jgi:hypothetical protein
MKQVRLVEGRLESCQILVSSNLKKSDFAVIGLCNLLVTFILFKIEGSTILKFGAYLLIKQGFI